MNTFRLSTPVHTETASADAGLISFDFPAGLVTPQSDQELSALLKLVESGLAVISDESGSKKSAMKIAEPTREIADLEISNPKE